MPSLLRKGFSDLGTPQHQQSLQHYYPFGMMQPDRQYSADDYRYGFNGKEKMDEVKQMGNALDFGERISDPRIGNWMAADPKSNLHPGWSPYKFALDNPIIFNDPQGETEFYFKGRWIGSDGIDNNLVARVNERKVKRDILRHTRKGLFYQEQSISKGAEKINGMLIINKDVLSYSLHTLKLSLNKDGKEGEFGNRLKKDGNNFSPSEEILYAFGTGVNLPKDGGDVSVHSHMTGMTPSGITSAANSPSPEDKVAFRNYDVNITVGMNNNAVIVKDDNGKISFDQSNRYPAINIYDSNTQSLGIIRQNDAETLLNGKRDKRGSKFEKKQQKND